LTKIKFGVDIMSRKHSMRIVTISLLVALLLVAPVVASTDGAPPSLPHTISGTILVNGQSAPVDTVLAAFDDQNNKIGYVIIKVAGEYTLPISEPVGKIHIYFQTPEMPDAVETSNTLEKWESGAVTKLDLIGVYTKGSPSSGKNLRSLMSTKSFTSTGTDDGGAIAGGASGDTNSKENNAFSSEADKLSDPSKKSSSSTLPIVALVGILAVAALFYAIYKKQNP
jgi:hypothetical protein